MNVTKDQLMELLKLATTNQLFQLDGILYEQMEGVATDSPLGPLLAKTFMCSIEEKTGTEKRAPLRSNKTLGRPWPIEVRFEGQTILCLENM